MPGVGATPPNDGGATRAVLLHRPQATAANSAAVNNGGGGSGGGGGGGSSAAAVRSCWLGLTVRGGVEHGLGHYISAVEAGSEADRGGLRAGDEILRVDGMALRGATHREAVSLISSR